MLAGEGAGNSLPSLPPDCIGLRVAAKDLDEGAVLLQFPNRFSDKFVLAMTFDIDEEKIFPVLPLRWPALDLTHAKLQAIERLDRMVERANAILYAEH